MSIHIYKGTGNLPPSPELFHLSKNMSTAAPETSFVLAIITIFIIIERIVTWHRHQKFNLESHPGKFRSDSIPCTRILHGDETYICDTYNDMIDLMLKLICIFWILVIDCFYCNYIFYSYNEISIN